jgi:hypothetical protein
MGIFKTAAEVAVASLGRPRRLTWASGWNS